MYQPSLLAVLSRQKKSVTSDEDGTPNELCATIQRCLTHSKHDIIIIHNLSTDHGASESAKVQFSSIQFWQALTMHQRVTAPAAQKDKERVIMKRRLQVLYKLRKILDARTPLTAEFIHFIHYLQPLLPRISRTPFRKFNCANTSESTGRDLQTFSHVIDWSLPTVL